MGLKSERHGSWKRIAERAGLSGFKADGIVLMQNEEDSLGIRRESKR